MLEQNVREKLGHGGIMIKRGEGLVNLHCYKRVNYLAVVSGDTTCLEQVLLVINWY